MGASSSTQHHYESQQIAPIRNTHTQLTLHLKPSMQSTFRFTQCMKKVIGEDQILNITLKYSGNVQSINTDVHDSERVIKGNPRYLCETQRVEFDVDWGQEYYQSQSGKLTVRNASDKEPASRTRSNNASNNHSPYSTLRSLADNDHCEELIESIKQPISSIHVRSDSLSHSSPSSCDAASDCYPLPYNCRSLKMHQSLTQSLTQAKLHSASSFEEMIDLLSSDPALNQPSIGTFTPGTFDCLVDCKSDEVLVQVLKARLEFIWAKVREEEPVIMAISQVYNEEKPVKIWLPRK